MSAHSVKCRNRHPSPTTFQRERFEFGHVTVEVVDHPDNGATFALIAGHAVSAQDRRPLFTGHITEEMPNQAEAMAARMREILQGRKAR